ncbi:MAG: DMT family transporter [Calditrichaeota bacterium]|nr:DMT family transporter [Calditrichota bacterium]
MKTTTLKSDFLLLITATIWGFAFVAQRAGMQFVGPFTFNAARFTLGALALGGLVWGRTRKSSRAVPKIPSRTLLVGAGSAGVILFLGSTFQQMGLVTTTAGKAGFITGLYVILVPILGIFLGNRTRRQTWVGAFLAVAGLYFLSIHEDLTMTIGDGLVLVSAFFWASHVLLIDHLTTRLDTFQLAFVQFLVCAGLSAIGAVAAEEILFAQILAAAVPILYAGLMSVGIAYTLQVVAQKDAHPSHAAIIMSLESVFAALGGWWILREGLTFREGLGCLLMLTGMVVSQIRFRNRAKEVL